MFRLFPSELEAVYEEKNRSMDGFMEPAYEAFMRSFFADHPYGEQPVLGTVEHLKRPSLAAMREFYETYYVPNNMVLVLSGDFEAATIAPMIASKFGAWKRGEDPEPNLPAVKKFSGRTGVTERRTPIRAAALAFHTPAQRARGLRGAARSPGASCKTTTGRGASTGWSTTASSLLARVIRWTSTIRTGTVVLYAPRVITQSMGRAERLVRGAIDELRQGLCRTRRSKPRAGICSARSRRSGRATRSAPSQWRRVGAGPVVERRDHDVRADRHRDAG